MIVKGAHEKNFMNHRSPLVHCPLSLRPHEIPIKELQIHDQPMQ